MAKESLTGQLNKREKDSHVVLHGHDMDDCIAPLWGEGHGVQIMQESKHYRFISIQVLVTWRRQGQRSIMRQKKA